MKKLGILMFMFCIMTTAAVSADFPDGNDLLQRIDKNMSSKNRIVISKMIIHGRRGSRTIEAKSWSQGDEKAFTEYLSPAREKGTKMLKLGDRLWTYSPSTDRTIQISGHMLRQSLMGSDLSYEDMMEDKKLSELYLAEVMKLDTIASRSCFLVKLDAKTPDTAYQKRILWVDQERFTPVKEELYAKSGTLLKTTELSDFRMINDRWYPFRVLYKDVLKSGKGTELIVDSIEFDQPIADYIFSKASLRR